MSNTDENCRRLRDRDDRGVAIQRAMQLRYPEDSMKARDLMTPDQPDTPGDSLQRVSQLMAEHDCGCIPVVTAADQRSLVGVVTDRDIAVRAVAEGRPRARQWRDHDAESRHGGTR
jgi:CBS-domain-containing membrane protein